MNQIRPLHHTLLQLQKKASLMTATTFRCMTTATRRGAENTENESIAESSATHGSAYPLYQASQLEHLHPADAGSDSSRSRASNLAASRGLNIAVTDKASRRHSRMIGLPHSPRPTHGASPHSPHTPQKTVPSPNLPPPSPHTPK